GAGGGNVGGVEGGAVADGGDLVPADPARLGVVGVGEGATRRLGGGQGGGQGALQPEGLKAGGALGEAERRPGDAEGQRPAVGRGPQVAGEAGALAVAAGGGLGGGGRAVGVGV